MCRFGWLEWDTAQLAGIAICGEVQRLNLPVDTRLALMKALQDILGWGLIWYPADPFPGFLATPTFVLAPWKMGEPLSMVLAFPATRTPADLALFIENIIPTWTRSVMTAVIPFYRFSRQWFFRSYQSDLSESIALTLAGPNRLSVNYWLKEMWFLDAMVKRFSDQPWPRRWVASVTGTNKIVTRAVAGHGAYGLLAKGIGWRNGWGGVAFDSSQFFDSPVSIFEGWGHPGDGDQPVGWTLDIHSDSSLTVLAETVSEVSEDRVMPRFGSLFDTPRVERTFCLTAAGCATTHVYDDVCAQFLGSMEAFYKMFDLWGRSGARE
jgi:hypothetical protein